MENISEMLFESYIRDFISWLPSSRIRKKKADMRALLEQKRRILTAEEVAVCSAEVVEQILASEHYKHACHILLYYPMRNEIDLRALLGKSGTEKHFYLPVTHRHSIELREYIGEEDLKKGRFGIPEPQTPTYKGKIDMMLIPGGGFDKKMQRMGRGGGYYDKLLCQYRHTWKVGVGYAFQLVEVLPHERHDKKMDVIITAKSK